MFILRCPFCHRLVLRRLYARHKARHTQKLPDGQMTDHITVHPTGRYQGSLAGLPRVYQHTVCGVSTQMPEEVMRSYLVNPFLYRGGMFCCGCGGYKPYSELRWSETGQSLEEYFRRLQAEYLRVHGEPPPRPTV